MARKNGEVSSNGRKARASGGQGTGTRTGGSTERRSAGTRGVLFEKLAHDYLAYSEVHKRSFRHDVGSMRRLLSEFGGRPAKSVGRGDIEAFRADLAAQGLAPATINHCLNLLRATYNRGIRSNTIQHNPMQGVRPLGVNTTRLRILTEEEETRLFAALPEPLHVIVEIDLLTGLRQSDLLGLEWNNVDLEAGIYTVQMIKTRGGLRLPMHPRVKEILSRLPQNSRYVFPGTKEGQPRGAIGRGFRNAVRRACILDFAFHDLRTTWAVRLAMAGVDQFTLMELGGWKTSRIVQRCAPRSPDRLREAIARLTSRHTAIATATGGKSPNAATNGETDPETEGKAPDTGVDPT